MSRDDKIIRKMKQSPRNIRFKEIDGFLRRQGFERRQPRKGSSHYFYFREDGIRFTITMPHGGKKTVDPAAVNTVLTELGL